MLRHRNAAYRDHSGRWRKLPAWKGAVVQRLDIMRQEIVTTEPVRIGSRHWLSAPSTAMPFYIDGRLFSRTRVTLRSET